MNQREIGAILRKHLLAFTIAGLCPFFVAAASACPYVESVASGEPVLTAQVDDSAAAHAARSAALVGANCSYSTGLMARKVIAEGRDWSFVGSLKTSTNDLASRVATPFQTVGGDAAGLVVGTELLETLVAAGHADATLALSGRAMEIDGVNYIVLTSFRVINA